MPEPEIPLESWKHFTALVEAEHTLEVDAVGYVYRGQSNARWRLNPSLLRYQKGKSARHIVELEQFLLFEFEQRMHLVDAADTIPGRTHKLLPEKWGVMQHHGAPTRLLDWTRSPYVAAYFAIGGSPEADDMPGAIYVAHSVVFSDRGADGEPILGDVPTTQQLEELNARLQDPEADSSKSLHILPQPELSLRLAAQQGVYAFAENVLTDHEAMLTAAAKLYADWSPAPLFQKRIIKPELKREFLSRLRAMNIGAHTLFPGMDGLGRYMAESALIDIRHPA